MIKFENVSKIYQTKEGQIIALNDIKLGIEPKEFISLAGQSGAGKTSLLKMLTAEDLPTSGKVLFDKKNVNLIQPKEMPFFRRRIGMVFQDFRLLSDMDVRENISFAMEVAGYEDEEIQRDVPQVLELVGMGDKINRFPKELSGGEKQRVAIARALIHRPDVILADEPTGNLDILNAWDIIRLLIKINELGTTIILATHDREIINSLNRRVITMDKGRVIRDEEKGRYIL